jgi:hypothetical protein
VSSGIQRVLGRVKHIFQLPALEAYEKLKCLRMLLCFRTKDEVGIKRAGDAPYWIGQASVHSVRIGGSENPDDWCDDGGSSGNFAVRFP